MFACMYIYVEELAGELVVAQRLPVAQALVKLKKLLAVDAQLVQIAVYDAYLGHLLSSSN